MALVPEIQNFANSQNIVKIAQINTREALATLAELGAVLPFDYPWWEVYGERLNRLTEQQEKLKKKGVVQAAVNDILAQYTTILTQLKHQLGDGGVDLLRTLAKNGHFELPDLTDDFDVSSEVAANISAVIKDVFDDTVTDCFQIRRALRAMFNRVLV
jgi:predicted nucleic acid-binding Zn ribbon protein